MTYDVTDWYFDEMIAEKKPHNPVEFLPAPVAVTKSNNPESNRLELRIAELESENAKLREELKNAITTIPEQQQSTSAAKPAGPTVATVASGRHPATSTRAEPDAVGIA